MNSIREKEIKEASYALFDVKIPQRLWNAGLCQSLEDLRNAFVLGAKWADEHPNSEAYLMLPETITNVDLSIPDVVEIHN